VLTSLPALQIQNGSACIHLSSFEAPSCLISSPPSEKDSPVAQSEADLLATDAEKAVEAIQISNLKKVQTEWLRLIVELAITMPFDENIERFD
tara:strand:+ start:404 stop:682 length:279 start_codon:yes stop_codon:yes gene_type:complete